MNVTVRWQADLEEKVKSSVQAKIEGILHENGLSGELELGIGLVTRDEMQALNLKFRSKDQPTDVLSFPLEKEVGPDKVTRLGDIVVCPEEALGQSIEFLILHGLNHLLGIHH